MRGTKEPIFELGFSLELTRLVRFKALERMEFESGSAVIGFLFSFSLEIGV